MPDSRWKLVSIRTLCGEGDGRRGKAERHQFQHFYPRPPRGGRPGKAHLCCCGSDFYPRPPRGGRPHLFTDGAQECVISIHALREEGDMAVASSSSTSVSFLSTPSARRATRLPPKISVVYAFLSTPSARRATCDFGLVPVVFLFLSTPSARRATRHSSRAPLKPEFLSTPSARRATTCAVCSSKALSHFYPRPPRGGRRLPHTCSTLGVRISIHALREEGDHVADTICSEWLEYFYPRPPRGGRLKKAALAGIRK